MTKVGDLCPNCGEERLQVNLVKCGGCLLTWGTIDKAERLVDAIGEALGVDTGNISEGRFVKAMGAALGEIGEP